MPNGHPYITHRMNALKKRRLLRKRVQWLRFGHGENVILRWHSGTVAELESGWRYKGKRHVPFVARIFTQPRLRYRTMLRVLEAKAK